MLHVTCEFYITLLKNVLANRLSKRIESNNSSIDTLYWVILWIGFPARIAVHTCDVPIQFWPLNQCDQL